MLVRRVHIIDSLGVQHEDIKVAEEEGLSFVVDPKKNVREYNLLEVLQYFNQDHIEPKLTMYHVLRILQVIDSDPRMQPANRKDKLEFSVQDALHEIEAGNIPDYPDPNTARHITVAHKNIIEARIKEQKRKMTSGDLVEKTEVMAQVHRVANLYEDKFGEKFIVSISEKTIPMAIALADGAFYEWFRGQIAVVHDEVIEEINHIELGLAE